MPVNFDEQIPDDLTFIVKGETFRMVWVRPEVLAEWEDKDEEAEKASAEDGEAMAALERLDGRVLAFLHPDDREKWTTLRAREDDAVPFAMMREIVRWMVEVQSQRPTTPSSPSEAGRGRTAASSSGKSRSTEVTAAA